MRTPPRFFFPRSVHTPRFRHGRGRSQPQNLGEAVNETHDVRDRESCAHLSPIHSPPLVRQSQPLRSRQPESTMATRKSCLKREIAELVVHGTSRRTHEKLSVGQFAYTLLFLVAAPRLSLPPTPITPHLAKYFANASLTAFNLFSASFSPPIPFPPFDRRILMRTNR